MAMHGEAASPEIIQTKFGQSWAEVARQVDEHTRSVQQWLSSRAPQAARFEGVGIIATSTGLPVSLLNLAHGANFPPDCDETTISTEIEQVKAFFAGRGIPWYWWVGPQPQPADFTARLEQQGLHLNRPGLPALAAPLPHPISPDLHPATRVWQANSHADLAAASQIRHTAFNFPDGAGLTYFEDMADDWLRRDPARLYLVSLDDGPPVAIGALIMGAGLPGVYIMATLPDWGRRGLGKAVMAHILQQAAADGHSRIALTAGAKGYPLYKQFGFEHIFDYKLYAPTISEGHPAG